VNRKPPEPISDDLRRWLDDELRRAKLDAMKELAYGASHEINNPLANIALRAQTLLKREDDADKRKALQAMHRAAMRAHEMISDLMLFARPPQPERRRIDLRDMVSTVVEELAPRAAELDVRFTTQPSDDPAEVDADVDQLAVALRAVVENSFDALEPGGEVAIEVRPGRGTHRVTVSDNGPGVPPEIAPHVFDPFFSGREAGRGLGFGLPKCWRIVTQHGGDVSLASAAGRGVVVTIELPAADSDA